MMKILVTGANGQLGTETVSLLSQDGDYEVRAYDRQELDITNAEQVMKKVCDFRPDWILHCAAYTNVEQAEGDGLEANWKINREGSVNISKAAHEVGAKLMTISTDYVFDGTKTSPYTPEDEPNPLNEYGKAKLAGEQAVRYYCPDAYIIRTSWVFGEHGQNFVYTMLKSAERKNVLKGVADQYGRPTYAPDLASFMKHVIEVRPESGIYHFSNDEEASWYEFAVEILKNTDVKVLPVSSEEFPQKAKRPSYSVMSLDKVKETGFYVPTWKDSLERFQNQIRKIALR